MRGLADGALARAGLLTTDQQRRAAEVLDRLERDGIETVRVVMADQHGILRGKTLVAGAVAGAFRSGVAMTSTILLKDTSHRTAFSVWSANAGIAAGPLQGAADLLLVPDPERFFVLPWAPHSAWLFCDVHFPDGRPVPFSARQVLARAVERLAAQGMTATIGLEVEFQLFRLVDTELNHADTTMPARPPRTQALTHGYQFLTDTQYSGAEDILDTLRRMAQGLGLPLRTVEIEMGPSQFEFTFDPAGPMSQADAMVMFRTMVKDVATRQGLHATFMGRPALANAAASGWHLHQSVSDAAGRNLFQPGDEALTPQAAGWIAGLLAHARASSVMVAPTVNSYKRYQPYQLAPDRVAWGCDNRGAMVRALLKPGDPASRLENRAPDSAANPYHAIAAQLISGLAGLDQALTPPPPTETPYEAEAERLPSDLGEALAAFETSALYRGVLGDTFVDYLSQIKRAEWRRYLDAVSDWEQAEYFRLF